MRPFALFAALTIFAAAAPCQYSGLATPADGSIVYFSIQQPRAGSGDPVQGRIYTVGPNGLELFAERASSSLTFPAVAPDGAMQAFFYDAGCLGFRPCVPQTGAMILGVPSGDPLPVTGAVQFSADGRLALVFHSGNTLRSAPAALLELSTGKTTRISGGFQDSAPPPGRVVANDGSVVAGGFFVKLFHGSQLHLIRDPAGVDINDVRQETGEGDTIIDPDGTTIVYVARWREPLNAFTRLRVYDIATGAKRTLVEGLGDFRQPVMSDDGQRVLFLTTAQFERARLVGRPQAYIISIDGSGRRAVTDEPSGIRTAILSGNGEVAFAVTGDGRLIRVDIDSGETRELLPRLVNLSSLGQGPFVGGSLQLVEGLGYLRADGTTESFRILFEGAEAPLVSSQPGEVWVQVPWELAGRRNIPFSIEADVLPGPFEQPTMGGRSINISAGRPNILNLPAEYGTQAAYGAMRFSWASHADFHGLVTPDDPARRGDVVNIFGIGFGEVDRPVTTGEPAPLDSLSRVETQYSCQAFGGYAPVEARLLFAGLAPGAVGLYQIQLEIPRDLPDELSYPGAVQIGCDPLNGNNDLRFVALLPVASTSR